MASKGNQKAFTIARQEIEDSMEEQLLQIQRNRTTDIVKKGETDENRDDNIGR